MQMVYIVSNHGKVRVITDSLRLAIKLIFYSSILLNLLIDLTECFELGRNLSVPCDASFKIHRHYIAICTVQSQLLISVTSKHFIYQGRADKYNGTCKNNEVANISQPHNETFD